MEQQYTFSTKRPNELQKLINENLNVFVRLEIGLKNAVAVSPNNDYKVQEMDRLTDFIAYVFKLVFLFNTQKIMQKFVLNLHNFRDIVNKLYTEQKSTIDEQISDKQEFIETNDRELQDFLQDQNRPITRKEYDKDNEEFNLMIGDDKTTEAKQEKESIKAIDIIKIETELRQNKQNERKNLDLLNTLKTKLNNELSGIIQNTNQTYTKTVEAHQKVMGFLEDSRQNLVAQYGTNLNQIKIQINEFQQNDIVLFKKLVECFNNYTQVFEKIQVDLKKIENNQLMTQNKINLEVAIVERPMHEIKIKYLDKKIEENELRLPACEALDSIPTLQRSVEVIYSNFRHINNNKPRLGYLDRSEVVVPKYEFQISNTYQVMPSEATQNLKNKINHLKDMRLRYQNKLGDTDRYRLRAQELYHRPEKIDQECSANIEKARKSNQNQLQQITQLIETSNQNYDKFIINRQYVKAFIGCIAQFMCVKKNVCLMCCRCCYSKDLHNYTDIYRKDYERIIIKHYQMHNTGQRNISIHQVNSFAIAQLPQLLLDLELVGAYRNEHGARQKLEFDFRFNDITKSIAYTGFEVANLLISQQMIQLGYDVVDQIKKYEQKEQAIETGELSIGVLEQHITTLA